MVPAEVLEVCRVLTEAGHQAVTVGGCVRDAILGRVPGDWDVASSAHPDQVIALFPRTIPTGIQHGTVTVMIGKGERRIGVEVTTYRGEGAYSDARRPDSVTFGVPLDEDLARRDLVINAIAFDPIRKQIHDPFGGRDDLDSRRIRAVGDPVARFTEDGLRIMRAVRFAAALDFAIDPETHAALTVALPSLEKVSRERVHDELVKLLAAVRPSIGLAPAIDAKVLACVLPEVTAPDLAWIDAVPRGLGNVRLAALLAGTSADPILRRLKFSNEDRDQVVRLVKVARAAPDGEPALRRVLAQAGRARGDDVVALWTARGATELASAARTILDRGDALASGELAVTGSDLMSELGMQPGREIGQLLAALLEAVLDEPERNTREGLIAIARAKRG